MSLDSTVTGCDALGYHHEHYTRETRLGLLILKHPFNQEKSAAGRNGFDPL
jgi:hypothetical protein